MSMRLPIWSRLRAVIRDDPWDSLPRWHLIQAVVLHDAEGEVVKFVGTTTDIDDQKRAEEALRESEYEARLIVDSIPGLIAVFDASGEIELLSQPILDYFGSRWKSVVNEPETTPFTPMITLRTFKLLSDHSPQEIHLNMKQYEFVVSMASIDG
jgi:PAS domain-containing protein